MIDSAFESPIWFIVAGTALLLMLQQLWRRKLRPYWEDRRMNFLQQIALRESFEFIPLPLIEDIPGFVPTEQSPGTVRKVMDLVEDPEPANLLQQRRGDDVLSIFDYRYYGRNVDGVVGRFVNTKVRFHHPSFAATFSLSRRPVPSFRLVRASKNPGKGILESFAEKYVVRNEVLESDAGFQEIVLRYPNLLDAGSIHAADHVMTIDHVTKLKSHPQYRDISRALWEIGDYLRRTGRREEQG